MAKKKDFQLIISGYIYSTCEEQDKISYITRKDLEILRPIFEAIKSNTDYYNWKATDSIYKENSDRWISHLDALYKMYNMRNIELEKLVLKTFPNSGYVDKITKIEVAEIKIKEKFL